MNIMIDSKLKIDLWFNSISNYLKDNPNPILEELVKQVKEWVDEITNNKPRAESLLTQRRIRKK